MRRAVEPTDRFSNACGREQPAAAEVHQPPPLARHLRCENSCAPRVAIDPISGATSAHSAIQPTSSNTLPPQTGRPAARVRHRFSRSRPNRRSNASPKAGGQLVVSPQRPEARPDRRQAAGGCTCRSGPSPCLLRATGMPRSASIGTSPTETYTTVEKRQDSHQDSNRDGNGSGGRSAAATTASTAAISSPAVAAWRRLMPSGSSRFISPPEAI
jgi:hypothetical protein